MIFSEKLLFSDAQAITATAVSTNVIDLGVLSSIITSRLDQGVGIIIPVLIQLVTAFTSTANTLTVTLQHSDTEGSGYEDLIEVPAQATSLLLTPGYLFPINAFVRNMDKRFLRINYTVSTTLVSGKITAGIVMSAQGNFS